MDKDFCLINWDSFLTGVVSKRVAELESVVAPVSDDSS